MNKLIPFHNDITFKTNIDEITSIALDKNIDINNDNIEGKFVISGSYKALKANLKEENFSYDIPVDITIDNKYDLSDAIVKIDDFKYEIIDDNTLDVNIDLLLDNIEEKENTKEIEEVIRPIEEIEILRNAIDDKEEINDNDDNKEPVQSLFTKFLDSDDTYSTYKVYIVRENDTMEKIMEKYQMSKEELSKYNDLNNIGINDKIVIPCNNERH